MSMPLANFLIAAMYLLASALWSCSSNLEPVKHTPAHVILFVGDGMGQPSENLTSRYLYGTEHALAWDSFPSSAWVATYDVSSYNIRAAAAGKPAWNTAHLEANDAVAGYDPAIGGNRPWPDNLADGITDNLSWLKLAATDSASSATAMSCGIKTDSGNIAWASGDPAGGELDSITSILRRDYGMALGLITTVPFSHATPAAFGAHNTSRNNYTAIAEEMIRNTAPQVLIGGGHPDFASTTWMDPTLLDWVRNSDAWVTVERSSSVDGGSALLAAAAAANGTAHLFGLFGGTDGAFEAPVPAESPGSPSFSRNTQNPSLAQAVQAALIHLRKLDTGFFLMVEQGDIDWANHANTLPRMVGATASLDEAVRAALDFVNQPGDDLTEENTLILVTADHATGGLRYNTNSAAAAGTLVFAGLAWKSKGHTNELVGIHAWGGGATLLDSYKGLSYPGTNIMNNTDIFSLTKKFCAGIAEQEGN